MNQVPVPVLAVVSLLALPNDNPAEDDDSLERELARKAIVRLQRTASERFDGETRKPSDIHTTLASLATRQQAFSIAGKVILDPPVSGVTTAARFASYRSIYIGY